MRKSLITIIVFVSLLLGHNPEYIDSLENELRHSDGPEKIDNLLLMANHYYHHDPAKSIEIAQKAKSISHDHDNYKLGELYLLMELCHSKATHFDSSLYYSQKALDFYREKQDTIGIARALNSIGIHYNDTNKPQKARKYYEKVRDLAEAKIMNNYLGAAYINLGILDFHAGKFSKALKQYLLALNIDQKDSNEFRLVNTYVNLGSLFLTTNNYEKSSEYFYEGMALAEKNDDNYHLWYIYHNLGFLYEKKENYKKAIEYADKSLEIAEITNDNLTRTYSVLSKIEFLIKASDYNDLDSLFKIADQYIEKIDYPDAIAYKLGLRRDYAMKQENYEQALNYHNQSVAILDTITYPPDLRISDTIKKGEILANLGKPGQATTLLNDILSETDELDLLDLKVDVYEALYKIYEDQQDIEKAFANLKHYTEYQDKMVAEERKAHIEELEIIHNIKNQQQETELLKKEKLIAESKLKTQKAIITAFVFIFILIATIAIINIISIINKRKINKKLQKQNKTIQRQKEELEKTIASKDRLYAIIGHDLYNAHSNISSFINVLNRSMEKIDRQFLKKLTKELDQINSNSLNLLDTLMEWGRIQTKKTNYSPVNFNLKAMVYNNLLLFKKNIEEKTLQIDNFVGNRTEVYADKNMVATVLRNVLSNAIKFTPIEGTIEINDAQDDQYIYINVIDNGVGMSKNLQEKLFKIEETISTRGTSGEKGHGLGLIICKELVDLHKGDIIVKSAPGKGTTVTIKLLIREPDY